MSLLSLYQAREAAMLGRKHYRVEQKNLCMGLGALSIQSLQSGGLHGLGQFFCSPFCQSIANRNSPRVHQTCITFPYS